MKGKLTFKGENGDGKIGNKGTLSASPMVSLPCLPWRSATPVLFLLKKGTVALASGKTVELQFGSQRKLEGIRVQPAKWKSLVENQHVIDAEEGLVILSAKGLTSLRGSVVNNSGKIQARECVGSEVGSCSLQVKVERSRIKACSTCPPSWEGRRCDSRRRKDSFGWRIPHRRFRKERRRSGSRRGDWLGAVMWRESGFWVNLFPCRRLAN